MASNPQEPASGFTEGKSYADCQACRTAMHCDFHKRCLAECSPKDLRASGGSHEPASGSPRTRARLALGPFDDQRQSGLLENAVTNAIEAAVKTALSQAQATIEALTRERDMLRAAIREHRDARGDDRCWRDDDVLYAVLPGGYLPRECDTTVELDRCRQYIENRQHPLTAYVSPQRQIEALEAALAALRSEQAQQAPSISFPVTATNYADVSDLWKAQTPHEL